MLTKGTISSPRHHLEWQLVSSLQHITREYICSEYIAHYQTELRCVAPGLLWVNSSSPGQNGRHFADDIFKRTFLNERALFLIIISLKFVPQGRIDNSPALVLILAWRRIVDKPLSKPMLTRLTDIYAALGGDELSGKASCHQISWSLEVARVDVIIIVSLRNMTGISAVWKSLNPNLPASRYLVGRRPST